MSFEALFKHTKPVMPVIVINDINHAVPLARALLNGGIHCLEITLRTDQGLSAIEQISKQCPDAIVGAGTVYTVEQMKAAKQAGAKFVISPGISAELCEAAQSLKIPYAPGVMTPSEIILGLRYGLSLFKLFPADIAGGASMLNTLSGPFPNIKFCPTGGISDKNAHEYFKLENVVAVGGSWVCPADLILKEDWAGITVLAQEV